MKPGSGFTTHQSVHGFTLIELMVVISIISILSIVGIVVYSSAQSKARDSVRKNDLNNLATALELYNQTKGFYFKGAGDAFYDDVDMKGFMNQSMPKDPQDSTVNYYYNSLYGLTYTLCAKLENESNSLCSAPNNYGVVPK